MHIPGIGKETENHIWKNNIHNWYQFLDNHQKLDMGQSRKEHLHSYVKQSIKAYKTQNHKFFLDLLPSNLHWRAYNDLKRQCCFLDIETTGLDKRNDDITMIGVYNGEQSKIFIKGKNMKDFAKEIHKYPMIITFNGRCFDIPFIQSKMPHLNLNKFHIDLRFAMKELGFYGGLKKIEQVLGLSRDENIQGIDGFEAVRLWYRYRRGDKEALQTLINYNKADIENLKILMEFTFKRLKQKEFHSIID